nr:MAG: O-antigen ligase domain-containing protein [Parapedobacter sp.]
MFLCFLMFAYLNREVSFRAIMKLCLVVLAIYVSVIYVSKNFEVNPVILDFIDARFSGDNESSGSFSSRTALYHLALEKYKASNPFKMIFGSGSGSFGYVYTGNDEMMYPHNLFLEILFEYGVVGLSMFLAMILRVLYLNVFTFVEKPRRYLFLIFYFALVVSQISRDITGNCLIFVFYIFIEDSQSFKFKLRKGKFQNEKI